MLDDLPEKKYYIESLLNQNSLEIRNTNNLLLEVKENISQS